LCVKCFAKSDSFLCHWSHCGRGSCPAQMLLKGRQLSSTFPFRFNLFNFFNFFNFCGLSHLWKASPCLHMVIWNGKGVRQHVVNVWMLKPCGPLLHISDLHQMSAGRYAKVC
jgi:hypothetical protein